MGEDLGIWTPARDGMSTVLFLDLEPECHLPESTDLGSETQSHGFYLQYRPTLTCKHGSLEKEETKIKV